MKRPNSPAPPLTKKPRFFVDDILGRRFFIENILSSQSGSGMANYVEKLESSVQHIPKFKTLTCRNKFIIKQLPADPEQLLTRIFQSVIDEAMKESRQQKIEPTHLGCVIASPLLDNEIYIPLRRITPNTIDTILNRFLQVGQSKKSEESSLWGEPFSINVTTLNRRELGNKRTIAGSGRRTHAAFHHRVNGQNLIKVTD